jgi:hypothetical protein
LTVTTHGWKYDYIGEAKLKRHSSAGQVVHIACSCRFHTDTQ